MPMKLHLMLRVKPTVPQATINNKSLSVVNYTAIDTFGCLGSLYNECQHQILGNLKILYEKPINLLNRKPRCLIKSINGDQSHNLLKLIIADEDLRLNILLGITSKIGLALIVDYSHPIDEYTRFFHYNYVHRKITMSDHSKNVTFVIPSWMLQTDPFYIITSVTLGISFVALLQLRCHPTVITEVDGVLQKFQALFESSSDVSSLNNDDINILRSISVIETYSNVPKSMEIMSLLQIHQYITEVKNNPDMHRPLTYTLQPIEWLSPEGYNLRSTYIKLGKNNIDKLERYSIEISNEIKKVNYLLEPNASKILTKQSDALLQDAQNECKKLQKAYENEIERMRILVSDIRHGQKDVSEIDKILKHKYHTTLIEHVERLTQYINNLKVKAQLTNSWRPQPFVYYYEVQHQVNQQNQTLYFNKKLTDNNQSMLSPGEINNEKRNKKSLLSPSTDIKTFTTTSLLPTDEYINILLLGESGVGKSTFINAFVNYLSFNTLQQAESNEPVVLIPVSFLMTVGDNFQERTIKFGLSDKTNNEDFDHPGQSVTQHCKSYVFNLDHMNGKKLRIIDTPGFGDTRGLDQDDLNIQHILEYINNLKHLNAICFLLKPNTSRLHIFFRTCFTQLFNFLGPNALQNLTFCFTNARSTFYTPGDTAPLLKTMLKSFSLQNIPFEKENTFCFDSESFRYLVALKNGISFNNEDEKNDYKSSWLKSVNEVNRLLNYICQHLTMYSIHDELISIKHAQIEINHMIRPMLEAMRNILRNSILCDIDSKKRSVILTPKPITHSMIICSSCKHELIRIAKFWFLPDCQDNIQSKNHKCSKPSNQHRSIEYILDYDIDNNPSNQTKDELLKQISLLNDASAIFSNFLIHTAVDSRDDLFLSGLQRIFDEEKYICAQKQGKILNIRLSEELKQLIHKYTYRLHKVKQNKKYIALSTIYSWIKFIIQNVPEVHTQMIAVKTGQEYIMRYYEYEVSNYSKNISIVQSEAL